MAELVAGIGVPHSPHYPAQYPEGRAAGHRRGSIARSRPISMPSRPDAIVVIANDHFNTFFMNNFPTFAIGVADAASVPTTRPRCRTTTSRCSAPLAAHLRKVAIDGRLRSLGDAGIRRRPRHAGAAALSHRRHQDAGGADLGQRLRRAAADGAPLLRARPDAARRDRQPAGQAAGRGDRHRQLLARDRRARRSIPASATRVPDIEWSKHIHRRIKAGADRRAGRRRPRPSGCGRPAISAASCSTGSSCSA